MKPEEITISLKTYERLLRDSNTLARLYAYGVDNWEGYGEAVGYDEDNDEDE